jgi:GTP-binding protein Era
VTTPPAHRFGFACLVGRPNAGKSTLTNALVGTKVAITSDRPQTTRHAVRGVLTGPASQLVLVDTPGLHRPRTLLGERLNAIVHTTLAEVDLVVFCVAADQPVGPGDRFLAAELSRLRTGTPVLAVVTKTDLLRSDRQRLAAQLLAVSALGGWAEVVPVSARSGEQLDLLRDLLVERLPAGPALFPAGEVTDEPEQVLIAELIREAALVGVRDELPHSLAVVVEEMGTREGSHRGLVDVSAVVYIERDSQKAIVIGSGGERLKAVGTNARRSIEALLGSPVYLDLRVKVAKDWQRDPRQLRRLGF